MGSVDLETPRAQVTPPPRYTAAGEEARLRAHGRRALPDVVRRQPSGKDNPALYDFPHRTSSARTLSKSAGMQCARSVVRSSRSPQCAPLSAHTSAPMMLHIHGRKHPATKHFTPPYPRLRNDSTPIMRTHFQRAPAPYTSPHMLIFSESVLQNTFSLCAPWKRVCPTRTSTPHAVLRGSVRCRYAGAESVIRLRTRQCRTSQPWLYPSGVSARSCTVRCSRRVRIHDPEARSTPSARVPMCIPSSLQPRTPHNDPAHPCACIAQLRNAPLSPRSIAKAGTLRTSPPLNKTDRPSTRTLLRATGPSGMHRPPAPRPHRGRVHVPARTTTQPHAPRPFPSSRAPRTSSSLALRNASTPSVCARKSTCHAHIAPAYTSRMQDGATPSARALQKMGKKGEGAGEARENSGRREGRWGRRGRERAVRNGKGRGEAENIVSASRVIVRGEKKQGGWMKGVKCKRKKERTADDRNAAPHRRVPAKGKEIARESRHRSPHWSCAHAHDSNLKPHTSTCSRQGAIRVQARKPTHERLIREHTQTHMTRAKGKFRSPHAAQAGIGYWLSHRTHPPNEGTSSAAAHPRGIGVHITPAHEGRRSWDCTRYPVAVRVRIIAFAQDRNLILTFNQ
ncbi:hypothetical protein C8R47DRAFT_1083764 [Mycena vitilis]|nr:hypothetical protein C8R47DRAFT_1083764 [Mycena vitilis]